MNAFETHFAPLTTRLREIGGTVKLSQSQAAAESYSIHAIIKSLPLASLLLTVDGETAQIASVQILGQHRRKGLARQYLDLAEEWARQRGTKRMTLIATGQGQLAWRALRPQARLKWSVVLEQEWLLCYPGQPLPVTAGELPEGFAANCQGYEMEWNL